MSHELQDERRGFGVTGHCRGVERGLKVVEPSQFQGTQLIDDSASCRARAFCTTLWTVPRFA